MLASTDFHKEFSALRIAPREIGVAGLKFTQTLSKEAMTALLFEEHNEMFSWRPESDITIAIELERENDHSFIVNVVGDFSLSVACVRCLNPITHRFPMKFSIRMLESEHLGKEADDEDWHFDSEAFHSAENEMTVGYFSEQCIDVGLILRDQIFFEAPDYPHCIDEHGSLSCMTNLPANEGNEQRSPFAKLFKKTN